jgi:hypothetical protein
MAPRSGSRCLNGLTACVIDPSAVVKRYECLDVASTLDSCGGCSADGTGVDCSTLEGVWDVKCVTGHCHVTLCESDWVLAEDGTGCLPQAEPEGLLSSPLQEAETVLGW